MPYCDVLAELTHTHTPSLTHTHIRKHTRSLSLKHTLPHAHTPNTFPRRQTARYLHEREPNLRLQQEHVSWAL